MVDEMVPKRRFGISQKKLHTLIERNLYLGISNSQQGDYLRGYKIVRIYSQA